MLVVFYKYKYLHQYLIHYYKYWNEKYYGLYNWSLLYYL